ncbi:MAG: MGMT family protein [Armatimonadetes bacterium]|nr:MGMT family protein [Armatimonadota bacterium]
MKFEPLYRIVRRIPVGRVVGYGQLGELSDPPFSPRAVGRAMAYCPDDVPWWRVLGGNGLILTYRRDPVLGALQIARLKDEGVPVDELRRVDMDRFQWLPTDNELRDD